MKWKKETVTGYTVGTFYHYSEGNTTYAYDGEYLQVFDNEGKSDIFDIIENTLPSAIIELPNDNNIIPEEDSPYQAVTKSTGGSGWTVTKHYSNS